MSFDPEESDTKKKNVNRASIQNANVGFEQSITITVSLEEAV